MLQRLSIHNLAILENVDLRFQEGFSILTGPTGAGKSLIIDSLSLLLGDRASSELIRAGEEKATIEGEFVDRNPALSGLLSKLGIPMANDHVVVSRLIGRTKNVIRVNGVVVTLADLNKIARLLATIHSQFDFARILNPDNYLEIIDGFAFDLIHTYKTAYKDALSIYRDKVAKVNSLREQKRKIEENKDFYSYQYNELMAADLKPGEDAAAAEEVATLRNYDKFYGLIQEARSLMDGEMLEKLYDLRETIHRLSAIQSQYGEVEEKIQDHYAELEDLFRETKRNFRDIDYDPARLEELEQREFDLAALKRKYHRTNDELIAYRDELGEMLSHVENIDGDIEKAEAEAKKAEEACRQAGNELSTVRRRTAFHIEKELTSHLRDLLLNARFSIVFMTTESFTDNGIDFVDFLIETNIGEGLKSMAKTISGGEASRIMLAFKAVELQANRVSTAIFDEIDTGISGEAAMAVAKKIREIALRTQTIAITHLPQVASLSEHAFLIRKETRGGRTYTEVKELGLEEKIEEVAHLISGGKVTEKQREYAREMILDQ